MRVYRYLLLSCLVVFFAALPAYCSDYYVSPYGSDSNSGSFSSPFKTISKAVTVSTAGDTIFLRGGQHDYTSTISISKNGTSVNPITLQAYENEIAVLDFIGQSDSDSSRGISLSGSYWHFRNFIIQNAGDNGLYITGTYNLIEQIITRMNRDSGLQLHTGAAYNLVLNCDSYLNYDAPKHGEDADGFAAKSGTVGLGNILRGCRSWNNSDDGYDFYYTGNAIQCEDCWSFHNGENIWGDTAFAGDGNGFKLGDGTGPHILIGCVAYHNPHNGIDVNGNTGGVTIYNCTGISNTGPNFYFDEHTSIHVLRNNLSYLGTVNIYAEIDDTYNSWNGFTVSASDFRSLDATGIDGARESDGGLPKLAYIHLASSSSLVDAGIDIGWNFEGTAPDLGAFEYLAGDCEPDDDIDIADLACFVSNWLDTSCGICSGADFDGDSDVDFYDYAMLANNWLEY